MRKVPKRYPEYYKDGKPIYNPGLVDRYQKPWYFRGGSGEVEYYGRFCEEGYPDSIDLDFDPLRKLIRKIGTIDPALKREILLMLEEMEDAHYAEMGNHIDGLRSAD